MQRTAALIRIANARLKKSGLPEAMPAAVLKRSAQASIANVNSNDQPADESASAKWQENRLRITSFTVTKTWLFTKNSQ